MILSSPRKLLALKAVCDYYVLTRPQIQRIVGARNDRVMRAQLQELVAAGLLAKTRMQVVNVRAGAPAPVYYPTRTGAELVAEHWGEERYLQTTTKTPNWTHLLHWVAVSQFHIELVAAVEHRPDVQLLAWFGEWDEANPAAATPQERFRIFTLIRERPRLVCAPDAAFILGAGPHSKCYYVEIDRGTSGIQQIASSKSPGYAALAAGQLHRRLHETTSPTFTVLHISPNAGRRDLLRKAFADKQAAELHRFAAFTDWTAEQALTDSIFHGCDDEPPQPLLRTGAGGER
ncbi:MAG: replication-relaxation family protein [Planctomycetales bacterium]|nr:replication-relaxation family protein [Planctomycetales bacterium]